MHKRRGSWRGAASRDLEMPGCLESEPEKPELLEQVGAPPGREICDQNILEALSEQKPKKCDLT